MESLQGTASNRAAERVLDATNTGSEDAPGPQDSPIPLPKKPRVAATTSSSSGALVCTVCNKPFTRRGALSAHVNTHTGAKPHKCEYPGCGAAFAARSNMIRHRRVHGKAFAEAAAMRKVKTVFEPPVVSDAVSLSTHMNVQWMVPNQASRGYTRYTVPPQISGPSSSSPSAHAPSLTE